MDALDLLASSNLIESEAVTNAPEATAEVTQSTDVWTGEELDVPLLDITKQLKRNLKFRLTVFTYMANSVGVGFFNSADTSKPTGRKALDIVNTFAEDWDLDTLNQKMARDVWASGNAFLNPVSNEELPFAGVYYLPLSSFTKIYRERGGDVVRFIQNWGGRGEHDVDPGDILHARWLPIDESAFGEGIGQAMGRRGTGYKTEAGKRVSREPWFTASEKIDDVSTKMIYAGLPRYFAFFEGEGASKEYIGDVNSKLNKLDPLQHFAGNVKGNIQTVSLDTQNRFDSFIRYVDDQIVSGTMSPLIRLWSSLNFTYASSKEAVDAMFPLIQMYQRFHKRFIERCIYAPLLVQEDVDVKKAGVRLNWGQEDPMTPDEIASVVEILKDPMFAGKINPDDFIGMFQDSGIKLTKPIENETQAGIQTLRNLVGLSDKGKTVVTFKKPLKQSDPLYAKKARIYDLLEKKYASRPV